MYKQYTTVIHGTADLNYKPLHINFDYGSALPIVTGAGCRKVGYMGYVNGGSAFDVGLHHGIHNHFVCSRK